MISDDPTIIDPSGDHQPSIHFPDSERGSYNHLGWFDQDDEDLGVGSSGSGSGENIDDEDTVDTGDINVTVKTQDKGLFIH